MSFPQCVCVAEIEGWEWERRLSSENLVFQYPQHIKTTDKRWKYFKKPSLVFSWMCFAEHFLFAATQMWEFASFLSFVSVQV